MKIHLLNISNTKYSSNAYLALGSWNRIEDVNTLVDVGTDNSILSDLEKINTGVGKKKVDQVILTHNHFDHIGNLPAVKELYNPKIYAFHKESYVDEQLQDGQKIHIGDKLFEVIYTPGHSTDSICLFCEEEGVLFTGDTSIMLSMPGGKYTAEFNNMLLRLSEKIVNVVYFGHGKPVTQGAREIIKNALKKIKSYI